MRVNKLPHLAAPADGRIQGTPYHMSSPPGVSGWLIHFWLDDDRPSCSRLQELLAAALPGRNIVGASWSEGRPS